MAASFRSRSKPARCWTRTDRITQLVVYVGCLICYLGVGTIAHAVSIGPDIEWKSALSWVLILGWPMVAFSWAALFGSIVGAILFWAFVLAPGSLVHAFLPVLPRQWSSWRQDCPADRAAQSETA